MPLLGPRIVVAGTHSGVGKTTVATGLLAALRRRGGSPAGAKVGPDFIDPGYHSLASGRPPRNLDPWLCGAETIGSLAGRAAADADLLVIEGVMGLFDGASDGTPSSTADVARMLGAPVLLVVDAAAMSASVAAVVHGFASFDPDVRVAGVVLNRVGSDGHAVLLREALEPVGIPVVGALRRDDRLTWRDRHLGLVPVAERPESVTARLELLAVAIEEQVDLAAVGRIAASAPPLAVTDVSMPAPVDRRPRVAVAGGRAFTFTYADTIDALTAAGVEVVRFDPLRDERLPDALSGLLIGGGFPEAFVADLAANAALLDDVRRAVADGLPTWAECGGLLYLCRSLDGTPLVGAIDADGHMSDRLTLGYREVTSTVDSPVGPAGTSFRGHEFHYSAIDPPGTVLRLTSRWGTRLEGHGHRSLLATYTHHHPGGDPALIARFAAAAAAHSPGPGVPRSRGPR
jgi:cobyrinic acid a,c-diamide synthase